MKGEIKVADDFDARLPDLVPRAFERSSERLFKAKSAELVLAVFTKIGCLYRHDVLASELALAARLPGNTLNTQSDRPDARTACGAVRCVVFGALDRFNRDGMARTGRTFLSLPSFRPCRLAEDEHAGRVNFFFGKRDCTKLRAR